MHAASTLDPYSSHVTARHRTTVFVGLACLVGHVLVWAAAEWYRFGLALLLRRVLPSAWFDFLLDHALRTSHRHDIADISGAMAVLSLCLGAVLVPVLGVFVSVVVRRHTLSRA